MAHENGLGLISTTDDQAVRSVRDMFGATFRCHPLSCPPSTFVPTPQRSDTGREPDPATGLIYYRARWYDPRLGQFISEDPMGVAAGDANLSQYVGNSTHNAVDPSGLDDFIPESTWAAWWSMTDRLNSVRVFITYRIGANDRVGIQAWNKPVIPGTLKSFQDMTLATSHLLSDIPFHLRSSLWFTCFDSRSNRRHAFPQGILRPFQNVHQQSLSSLPG